MTGYVGSTHTGTWRENRAVAPLLYLDQNYLSGFAKGKPAFRELEVALRGALARGAVAVVESEVHELESLPRPDLGLLDLLRSFSGGGGLAPQPPRGAPGGGRA